MDLLVENVLKQLNHNLYILVVEYHNGVKHLIGYSDSLNPLLDRMFKLLNEDVDRDLEHQVEQYGHKIMDPCYTLHYPTIVRERIEDDNMIHCYRDLMNVADENFRNFNDFKSRVYEEFLNCSEVEHRKVTVDGHRFKWYKIYPIERII